VVAKVAAGADALNRISSIAAKHWGQSPFRYAARAAWRVWNEHLKWDCPQSDQTGLGTSAQTGSIPNRPASSSPSRRTPNVSVA
jgi:hypothetical protein